MSSDCFGLFVESARKVSVLRSRRVPNWLRYFRWMYSTSVMFVSNTALTRTILLWLYDMGMFPELHSVRQYPHQKSLPVDTLQLSGSKSLSFLLIFFKAFCTFHLCKSISYVLCTCKSYVSLALCWNSWWIFFLLVMVVVFFCLSVLFCFCFVFESLWG